MVELQWQPSGSTIIILMMPLPHYIILFSNLGDLKKIIYITFGCNLFSY